MLKNSANAFTILIVVAILGAVYLGLSGGHSELARRRVDPGSSAVVGMISDGDSVELADFAAPVGRTIFEFSATWCGACRRLAPTVEALARSHDDTVLRVIDIGSWESPVAKRYGIRAIPHLVLFEDGEPVTTGTRNVLDAFE